MLSQACVSLPVSAFGLTRGVPSATAGVNKDCLLCSPFPRWPQVGALPETDSVGSFSLRRKVLLSQWV